MSIQDDLLPNEKFAENEEEEQEAEDREDRRGEDIDDMYDRIRDDNSIELMEMVEEVIENANKLIYFKNRPESIAQDIIQAVLSKCNVKIEVQDLSEIHQHIRATKRLPNLCPNINECANFKQGFCDYENWYKCPYFKSKTEINSAEMTESECKGECERIAIKQSLED